MTDDSPRRVLRPRLGTVVPDPDGGAKIAASDCTRRRVALFLDVDGTLLDLARRPDEVVVPTKVVTILTRLETVLAGAHALAPPRATRREWHSRTLSRRTPDYCRIYRGRALWRPRRCCGQLLGRLRRPLGMKQRCPALLPSPAALGNIMADPTRWKRGKPCA